MPPKYYSVKQPPQATYFKQTSPTSAKANGGQPTPSFDQNKANICNCRSHTAITTPGQLFLTIIPSTYNLSTPKTISAIESSQVPAPNAKDPTPAGPSKNCAIDEG